MLVFGLVLCESGLTLATWYINNINNEILHKFYIAQKTLHKSLYIKYRNITYHYDEKFRPAR